VGHCTGGRAISTNRDYYARRDRPQYRRDDGYDHDYDDRPRRRYDSGYSGAQDEEHLRILSILYYVLGGLAAFGGLIPLLWVFFGAMMVAGGGSSAPGGPPLAVMGWIFICVAGFISLLLLSLAGLKLYAGYCLSQRKAYVYCFVIACLACIHMPLGTLLGVFTIIVLNRPSVKDMFYGGSSGPGSGT
jgi:hypothetical protein